MAEMRNTGFRDAFVVADYNGKRISLQDARARIEGSGEKDRSSYSGHSKQGNCPVIAMNIKAVVSAQMLIRPHSTDRKQIHLPASRMFQTRVGR
jgi:hypothetical protein